MDPQEARTRAILKATTLDVGSCARCDGERLIRTPRGLKHCECYFRQRTAAIAPALIRGGDALWDFSLLSADPWSPAYDRRDTGNFDHWRHMAWRSLASARYQEYLDERPHTFAAEALFTYELQEVHFNRDERFTSVRQLTSPRLPLLILLEGIDPLFVRETVHQLLQLVIPTRRARGLATWMFHLESSAQLLNSPALEGIRQLRHAPYAVTAMPLTRGEDQRALPEAAPTHDVTAGHPEYIKRMF